jgi:putative ubiquitin-RnfH superfamily antitoxin RatB of RatAB toxin-antitoxin module
MRATVRVQVVYAQPLHQDVVALELEAGATLREAIERSGVLLRHPEIDSRRLRVGICGRLASPASILRDGDRVEIYRPLEVDPKEMRHRRAVRRARTPRAALR